MEGDRILKALKSESPLNGLVNDVKSYLSPVLTRDSHAPTRNTRRKSLEEKPAKYELFSLKLLKQCIELWKGGRHGDTAALQELGFVCVDSLVVCSSSSGKAPPLSFEKLLFHFASQCVASGSYEAGMRACRVLCQRVESSAVQSTPKLMKEGQSLLKHSYDLIWKAAIRVEQDATKLDSPDVKAVGLSLELRKMAFLCLLSADFDLCFLLDRVVRSDLRYQKVCTGFRGTDSSCNYFEKLYAFHASLLESRDLCDLIDPEAPCRTLSSGVEYLLALAKVCEGSGRRKKGAGYVAKARSLCQLHAKTCPEKLHLVGSIRSQVAELITLLTETDVCTSHEHQDVNFPGESLRLLESVASGLESILESRALDPTSLPRVTGSLEALVSTLETRREEFRERMAEEGERDASYTFCPKQAFLSLQRILAAYVSCVERQLRAPTSLLSADGGQPATIGGGVDASLERSVRARQLSMLSVLSHFLLDLLLAADDGDGYDEIEIARGSAATPRPIVAEQSPAHHPKKDLANLCLPVLTSSQSVLVRASPGLLLPVEHKYLGNEAYNFGVALHRCELYREASSVLELACRELGAWCAGEETEERSQVLKKFVLLFDCHRQTRQFHQLLASVESAIALLSANEIAAPSCVSLLVGQWVEAKKEAIAVHPKLAGELSRRTLAEVLSQHSFPKEVRALYLQEELRTCKTLSPAAAHSSFQLAVVEAQLQLYGEEWGCESGLMGRARATTELAALRRVLREDRESSALELLDEALSLLDPLVSAPSHTPRPLLCQAQEQLALTHVWRAISFQEQLMGSCDVTPPTSLPAANEGGNPAKPDEPDQEQESERVRQLCLSPAHEEAMLSEDAAECLLLATQAWEGLWGTLRESDKCQANECFYDRPSTFQFLHLTSALCLAHRKPLLALRILGVLIEIFHWAPSPELLPPYQQALSQYCELALEAGASEEHRARLEAVLAGTTPSDPSLRGRGLMELEGSHLGCRLALARSKMERGMLEDCRELLGEVFRSPLLSRHNPLTYHLTARAKTTTARYLQHSTWTLQPGNEFLRYLLSEPCQPLERGGLRLTSLELHADATRLCRGLANSNNATPVTLPSVSLPRETPASESQPPPPSLSPQAPPPSLSPQASSWRVLCQLLGSLRSLARVYLLQGGVREAHCYAREGLMLAKSLLLHGWYVEFLLLLAEVQLTRGALSSGRALLQQAARLTNLHSYLAAASLPSPRSRTPLPLHPAACLCSSCSNPTTLQNSVSTLQLWVGLQLEGEGQEDDTAAKRWLQILSEASKLADACRKKCDKALNLLPRLEPLGGKQLPDSSTRCRNRGRRRKGTKPSKASAGDPPLSLDRSPAWTCLLLRSTALKAETLLASGDSPGCLASVDSALSGLQSRAPSAAPEYRSALARLHYTAGVATLHQEEGRDPGSSEELWGNSRGDQAGGLPPTPLGRIIPEGISAALEHFLASYQLCYPTCPAHLLRDTCRWLCVCLSRYHSGLAFHFLALGTQLTLGHQAVYALGKRVRTSPGSMQQSPFQDILDTLSPAPPPAPHHSPTLAARNTLTPPPTPPPLSHTHHLLNSLPENWTICTLSLAPKTAESRGFPLDRLDDTRDHLLVARARQGEGPRVAKVPVADSSAVRDLGDILSASGASMTLTDKKSWWSTRRQLDELVKELLNQLETSWLGSWRFLLEPPTDATATGGSSQDGPIILLLGQRVQALPWEATPTLARSSVGRMPSLGFTVAHRHLLVHSGSVLADPRKVFYVLNPRGDLPNTEKVFAGWFTNEQGWRGVVGRSPTTEEFTVALQNHSLFVYCGHGTGREYLSTDGFHQLCCQATTVLMGCSSGRLTGGGACDPGGVAFSYLMAGCPSLVANLWDVTDGDIDRFCKTLLKSWLRDSTLALSSCVSDSRSACRLQQLVGASPVLYGVPLAYSAK